jgi:3-hydroxyisobutyrate dehydrogenase-like beta-hydroxyacid dehydrogenase
VRDWAQTEAAILGADGYAGGARDGADLLVMSTLDPTSMSSLAGELARRGVSVVAAPVSGGRAGAEAATLSIMASGRAEAIERNRPLFDALGKNLFVLGEEPGMGQAAKLANQLMLGINMLGAYEGLRLATAHGVDDKELMRLLSVSTGGSWVTQNWERIRGFWESYVPGNDLDIICKDLRSALKEGDEQELSMPVTAVAFQRIRHVWSRD